MKNTATTITTIDAYVGSEMFYLEPFYTNKVRLHINPKCCYLCTTKIELRNLSNFVTPLIAKL